MSKPEPSITVYLNDDGSAKLFNPSDLTLYCGPNLFYSAAALEAVRRAALEEAARRCEQDLCNRPDDPPANYFDGGLRHCAAAIRALIENGSSNESID